MNRLSPSVFRLDDQCRAVLVVSGYVGIPELREVYHEKSQPETTHGREWSDSYWEKYEIKRRSIQTDGDDRRPNLDHC